MSPVVYAIVLNWNGWRDTVRCLESLRASSYPALHVIVIDNDSTDGSRERLAELLHSAARTSLRGSAPQHPGKAPTEELLCLERNLGFTGGVNAGLRLALDCNADHVFLLNNDATVEPDCIARLVDAAADRPDVGLAGPKIVWADEPARIWSASMSVAWHRAAVAAHRDQRDDGRFDGRHLVQGLSACALLVKRGVLERVGLLDERYFAYYEDLDWCLRARRAGFRCLYVGDARVCHAGSATSNRGAGGSQSALINYYGSRNALLFMSTHAPIAERPLALACLLGQLLAATARIVAGGLVLRRPEASKRAGAIMAGIIDAARGRFGARHERSL